MVKRCAVLAALFVAALLPGPATAAPHAAIALRVLDWNIHYAVAQGSPEPPADIDKIAADIKAQHPDIVTLQEVHQNSVESGNVDQVQKLADALGMTPVFGDNDTSGDPGSQQPPFQGTHGNLVLSRFPVLERVNWHMPRAASDNPTRVTRGTVGAKLDVNGTQVRVYSTQLTNGVGTASKASRQLQVNFILGKIGKIAGPVLLTGDFNAEGGPNNDVTKNGFADTAAKAGDTSPANAPNIRLDYVFAKSLAGKAASVLPVGPSDHRGVLVDLNG